MYEKLHVGLTTDFSETNDSHQPQEARTSPTGRAHECGPYRSGSGRNSQTIAPKIWVVI